MSRSHVYDLRSILRTSLAAMILFIPFYLPAAPVPEDETVHDLSLYEVGGALAVANTPDYPASNQNHTKFIPAPYFIYRGKIFRADREGTRARLLHSQYASVDLSGSGSFSARSRDDDARHGMPDLDYLIELGPRLSVPLSDLEGYGKLLLFVPVRAVFSTNFSNLHDRGFTLTPALFARIDHFFRPDWIWISQLSANFASRQLMSYFYDVQEPFVTPTRGFYDAHEGYYGTDWFNGLAVPIGSRVRLFGGIQLWEHAGDANRSSPLFRRDTTWTTIFGVSYTFYESKRMAKRGLD